MMKKFKSPHLLNKIWERDGSASVCPADSPECTFEITEDSGLAAHFEEK